MAKYGEGKKKKKTERTKKTFLPENTKEEGRKDASITVTRRFIVFTEGKKGLNGASFHLSRGSIPEGAVNVVRKIFLELLPETWASQMYSRKD